MLKPKNILELGTYTGYSALCLAEGLAKDGKLTTIDSDKRTLETAQKFFAKSAFPIESLEGDITEILPTLTNSYDLVFLDADKRNYINYYRQLKKILKSGSVILADNVLWKGKVYDAADTGKQTEALREFNEYIKNDAACEQVMLPVRDGISLIRIL